MLRTVWRLLTFRASREELLALDGRHLALGLMCTLFVGVGRTWDNPRAQVFQQAGLGSLAFVCGLTILLWCLVAPLRPEGVGFVKLLTFVSLLSPIGAVEAIPVERFLTMDQAQGANAWFLVLTVTWRVALLLFFLIRVARLRWLAAVGAAGLASFAAMLAVLVMNPAVAGPLFWGDDYDPPTSADSAQLVTLFGTAFGFWTTPVLFGMWAAGLVGAWTRPPASGPGVPRMEPPTSSTATR